MAAPKPSAGTSLSRLPLAARAGIGAALLGLVLVAYFVVPYGDVSKQITQAKETEATDRNDLATAKQSEAEYLADAALLAEKQNRQRELNKVLPETPDYPAFLSAVQGVANVSGVQLNSWEPKDLVPAQYYSKVPMRITLAGRFHQIAKFLYGVGQLDRIINVEDLQLKEPKVEGDDVIEKVECLTTAFQAKPAGSGSAKPAAPPPGGGK